MTSSIQPDLVTEPATARANQPSISSTVPPTSVPVTSAPVSAPAAVKLLAKKVARTPVKKTTAPTKPAVKSAARVAVKPVARTATPRAAVKSVVSTTPTAAPKAAAKAPAKVAPKATIAPASKPVESKLLKAKKPKLVRDSFTIPKLEYLKLEELKHRSVKLGASVKKSELIRAGIMALAAMTDAHFLKATQAVPAIKTGRPAKD